jgi:hypothetical protein
MTRLTDLTVARSWLRMPQQLYAVDDVSSIDVQVARHITDRRCVIVTAVCVDVCKRSIPSYLFTPHLAQHAGISSAVQVRWQRLCAHADRVREGRASAHCELSL